MERLSIDEVITHCNRRVESFERFSSRQECENWSIDSPCTKEYWEHRQVAEWLKQLKAYKDAEEQGLLLRLPCKVGDTVYLIFERRIYEGTGVKIVSVRTPSHDYTRIEIVFEIEDPWYSDGRKMKHGANEILGEKVFLTKEEAEQALAERKNDE